MRPFVRPLLAGLLVLSGAGCDESTLRPDPAADPKDDLVPARFDRLALAEPFVIRDIPLDSLWWKWSCCSNTDGFPMDSAGIPYLIVQGKVSYHPSYIIENGYAYGSSYEKSGIPIYRTQLKNWVDFLLQRADTLEYGAIYNPYDFSIALHNDSSEMLYEGWYSGFTQGMFLALLVRTARITGEQKYIDAAHRAYRGLTDTGNEHVSLIDDDGYYWIDDYPGLPLPDLPLNGHLYAMRGLYEYWQWNPTPETEYTLRAALTTMKAHAWRYRNPGSASVYCLRHRLVAPHFHDQIIMLLNDAYRMSGDSAFLDLVADYESDYP